MSMSVHTTASRAPSSRLQARSWAVVSCTAFLSLTQLSCQKQHIKVKGHDLATILAADRKGSHGIPIDLPGALEAAREVFQTRGVIDLSINSEQISPNSSLELVNTTTGFTLIKAPAGAMGLTPEGDDAEAQPAWNLAGSGYEFKLIIYPLDPSFVGKFAYGDNQLTLNVGDQTAPKDAKQKIAMQDFSYFAPASAIFSSNDQQLGGFQGEMISVVGPFTASGSEELATGTIGILNR